MTTLFDAFAVLKPDLGVDQLQVTPTIYQQLDQLYGDFRSHVLVSSYAFTQDWPTWEMHPVGDEIVVLLSGKAEFILRQDSADHSIGLSVPGSYIVVPKGAWHTAHISEPTSMLFITPGEGTQNQTEPPL